MGLPESIAELKSIVGSMGVDPVADEQLPNKVLKVKQLVNLIDLNIKVAIMEARMQAST